MANANFYTGPVTQGVNLQRCTTAAEFPLGTVVEGRNAYGMARYRYVQFRDAVTYVAGHFVNLLAGATTWQVTNDISGAMAGYVPGGLVFQDTVPTQNQYGWIQVSGMGLATMGSASVIAGDFLKNDGTSDGLIDEATHGGTDVEVAQALATIADNATGLVLLTIQGV